jgi:hypothetical protein
MIVTVVVLLVSCGRGESEYIGRWECASDGDESFEIKVNDQAFLVTDEAGTTYPASIDDQARLVVTGVPLMGSLPLPIDSESGELICSACDCKRFRKVAATAAGTVAAQPRIDDREALKQTVGDLRDVGVAMMSWLTDEVSAGAAGQSAAYFAIQQVPVISHQELQGILSPAYLEAVPERDGWGHPYEFYLNVSDLNARRVMAVRSPGRDGRFSGDTYSMGSFDPERFDEDIVWADGFFVRWPERQ